MPVLKVMTWNILHKTSSEEEREHPWQERAPLVRAVVERARPHILCTQEAHGDQMDDLLAGLPDYWWFGRDRDGRDDGEGCPIAYDSRLLKPLEWGQLWLGAEPETPGCLTWVNDVPRLLTWGRFLHYETGQRFFLANTHLDHLVPGTRTKAIELLQERLPPGSLEEPVILTGDFNSPAWAKPHRMLMKGPNRFYDTYKEAEDGEGLLAGTFHKWKGTGWARLDWILTQPRLRVPRYRILRDKPQGRFPSDHYPVLAEIELPHPPAPPARAAAGEAQRI